MSTAPLSRRIVIAAGGAALVAMSALTACSPTKEKEAPSSTPPATTSPASPSATEKAMLPSGDGSFSPTVNPMPPGAVCKQVVNGVCQR